MLFTHPNPRPSHTNTVACYLSPVGTKHQCWSDNLVSTTFNFICLVADVIVMNFSCTRKPSVIFLINKRETVVLNIFVQRRQIKSIIIILTTKIANKGTRNFITSMVCILLLIKSTLKLLSFTSISYLL